MLGFPSSVCTPMPIYAYRCATCGHAQDVLQKMSDPLLTVCTACGAPTFEKQVTAAGFQLKGSGWYVTDFRNGNTGAPAKKEGEANASGDAAADADQPATDKADKSAAGDKPAADKPAATKSAGAADKPAAAAAAAPAASSAPATAPAAKAPSPPAAGG
jgi:putative FmdB family regulatory protein